MPLSPDHKHVDLHLLLCLEALLQEESVTRAAQRLGMSQPGMSNALARLRQLTGDTLLVRTSNGMALTPRAQSLRGAVRQGLAAMEEILADSRPFVPAEARATITLAAADSVGVMLMPRFMQHLAEAAPGLGVDMRLPDPARVREWLSEGECDLAIGFFPELPDGLRSSSLFSQSLSCIAREGHPAIHDSLSLAQYMAAGHVIFGSPFAHLSTMEAALDEALAAQHLARRCAMRVSSVMIMPYVVARTDYLATMPTWMARQQAAHLPLRHFPLPLAGADIDTCMVWHERTHPSPLHQWVREQLRWLVQQDPALAEGDAPLRLSERRGITHVE